MPWVKLDDQFPDHIKLATLGRHAPLCGWLYVCGLAFCNRQLTDGHIPKPKIYTLAGFHGIHVVTGGIGKGADQLATFTEDVDVQALANLLVACGLWEEDEFDYIIHDYLEYQPSRESVLADREATRVRVGRYRVGHPRGRNGRSNAVGNAVGNGSSNAVTTPRSNAVSTPAPDPDPDPVQNEDHSVHRADALVRLWNEVGVGLPQCRGLNPARRRKAMARLHEQPDLDYWASVIQAISASSFCRGGGAQGWRASFDWLLQPDTALRVLEGKYADAAKPLGPRLANRAGSGSTCPHEPQCDRTRDCIKRCLSEAKSAMKESA